MQVSATVTAPAIWTLDEVAKHVRKSTDQVRRDMKSGRLEPLPRVRSNEHLRFSLASRKNREYLGLKTEEEGEGKRSA
ncbi:hypothetical protein IT575_12025 [bacterium]|nr:hypothetical protein [bacterium]